MPGCGRTATTAHFRSWKLVGPWVSSPVWCNDGGENGSDSGPATVGDGVDRQEHLHVVPGHNGAIHSVGCPDPMQ